jgi:heavy metal sensor kinase
MLGSIRGRIALACFLVWAVILVVSASGTYFMLRHNLYARMDASLESTVQIVDTGFTHEILERPDKLIGENEFSAVLYAMHDESFPGTAIAIFDGTRPVAGEHGVSGITMPASVIQDRSEGTKLRTVSIAGVKCRVATHASSIPASIGEYTVVAGEPLRSIDEALGGLRTAILGLVPLALILAAIGGYYLAHRSLQPVVKMAEAVDQINSANLAQRLKPANPDDELGHLANTFNRLLSRLSSSFEQQQQFMADASHELRTPLSVSLLTAQVALEKERSGHEYREAIATIHTHLERLNRLVQDMLMLARSDGGGYLVRKVPCMLDELILDAAHSARILARPKGIRIETGEMSESPFEGDPELIRQLLLILLDNAVKYSPCESKVAVTLHANAAYEVLVMDEGLGIPESDRERIFDRFYRVEASRSRASGGSGLGLPIAKWIASVHGGSVNLAGSGPDGSTFRVRLPKPKECS